MRRPPWLEPIDPMTLAREVAAARRSRRAELNAARAVGLRRRHAAKQRRTQPEEETP